MLNRLCNYVPWWKWERLTLFVLTLFPLWRLVKHVLDHGVPVRIMV